MPAKIVSGADYIALPSSPTTWLIDPLLPSGGAMLLYGDPKVGKSFAALQLAEAIQNGDHWLGFLTHRGRVVYIQLDTPRNVWQARIHDLQQRGHLICPPYFTDRELLDTWPFNILNLHHFVLLKEALIPIAPDLVIIDTLRESHAADENDSTPMQKVIAALVAATYPAALCLVSHARKPSQDDGFSLMNDNRGSSYVVGRMDAIVRLTPKTARVGGRSIEEHTLPLERADSGFWDLATGDLNQLMTSVLRDPASTSVRAAAQILARKTTKSESACRGQLRRFLRSRSDLKTHF